jgi:hypothetical protein
MGIREVWKGMAKSLVVNSPFGKTWFHQVAALEGTLSRGYVTGQANLRHSRPARPRNIQPCVGVRNTDVSRGGKSSLFVLAGMLT